MAVRVQIGWQLNTPEILLDLFEFPKIYLSFLLFRGTAGCRKRSQFHEGDHVCEKVVEYILRMVFFVEFKCNVRFEFWKSIYVYKHAWYDGLRHKNQYSNQQT